MMQETEKYVQFNQEQHLMLVCKHGQVNFSAK